MKKIPTLFKRDYENTRLVFDEITPGCEWVIEGIGTATRKFDGTACMIKDGKLFKRYDCKIKSGKQPPEGFIPCQDPDPITNHWPGWIPIGNGPDDKYHREAFVGEYKDGTYELCGPKINGNPEKFDKHILVPHGEELIPLRQCLRNFEGLKELLSCYDIEGIVFHSPDGKMCKIKKRDFGIKREDKRK